MQKEFDPLKILGYALAVTIGVFLWLLLIWGIVEVVKHI